MELMFYIFSVILVASSLAVVVSKNPVHSVLFLILGFFNAAGLFLLLGAEFLAMLLVVVYVGAVAVLFLFVVMMLNVNTEEKKGGFLRYFPLALIIIVILYLEIVYAFSNIPSGGAFNFAAGDLISKTTPNTQALGLVLYTKYALAFQISGLILFVAMVGAIMLTFDKKQLSHRQDIGKQVARKREEAVEVVSVEKGKGVDV